MKNNLLLFSFLLVFRFADAQTGNVGVNTSTPSSKLEIKGDGSVNILNVIDENSISKLLVSPVGNVGVGITVPVTKMHIVGTDALVLPVGTTLQRPATPPTGSTRFNSDIKVLEYFDGTDWISANMEQLPIGTIISYAGPSVPNGWLLCDGSAISRTTYDELYAAIGAAWGNGNGSTTFNIPDLRGRFPRGTDEGTGRDPDATSRTASNSGGNTGNNVGTVQNYSLATHTHALSGSTDAIGNHNHSWGGWWSTDNAASVAAPNYGDNTQNTYSDGNGGMYSWNNFIGSAAAGSHNHSGSTGNPNASAGYWIPFDDNTVDNEAGGNDFGGDDASTCGESWDGHTTGGNFIGRLTDNCFNHTHTISTDGNHTHSVYLPSHRHWIQPRATSDAGAHSHTLAGGTASTISGATTASESRPKNVYVKYIIKAENTGTIAIKAVNIPTGVLGQTLRYDGSNWIANSLLYNSGTSIGIGTTSPSQTLTVGTGNVLVSAGYVDATSVKMGGTNVIFGSVNDVYGNFRVLQNNSTTLQDGMFINYNSTGGTAADLRFFANGTTERMRIQASTGNIAIGAATTAGSRLAIVGGDNSGVGSMSWLNSTLEIRGNGTGAADISFHRPGSYGANFGLDTDNWFSTQGWSAGGGYTGLKVGNVLSSGYLAVNGLGNAYAGVNGVNSVYYHATTNDSWLPYPGNNYNYLRGNTYAFSGTWYDENNGNYYADLNNTTRVNAFNIYNNSPTINFEDADNVDYYAHINSDRFYILYGDGGWDGNRPFTIFQGNKVGIGTASPSFPLEVSGGIATGNNSYGYLSSSGNTGTASGNVAYSIAASNRIRCPEFNAISDERIKTNITPIETISLLSLLKQLPVVHYNYIDSVSQGNKTKTGFIAQEVEKFMPSAVNQADGFIPNVFTVADKITPSGTSVIISVPVEHTLIPGDAIKIFDEKNQEHVVKVAEVTNSKTFTVNDWQGESKNLFIYGKKVVDFRSVDFDQLTSLSIGAIQELSKQMEELRNENVKLREGMKNLKAAQPDMEMMKQLQLEIEYLRSAILQTGAR